MVGPKYVVITPARNEAGTILLTIHSVLCQTITPGEWVLVDDGSTDYTREILDAYSHLVPWIRAIHRPDRGFREAGRGVIEAFEDGYRMLSCTDWEYVVKLDGDLSFDRDYFEKCFRHFANNARLGIAGGTIQSLSSGKNVVEENSANHVRGATKIYRRACWDMLGGLLKAPGWDTLDEVKANMLGWQTTSFPDVFITQHRMTGEVAGWWSDGFKDGRADYFCNYHPLFMLLKCVRRLFRKPYVISSAALMCGFVSGYLQRRPVVGDPKLRSFLRRQQLKRLMFFLGATRRRRRKHNAIAPTSSADTSLGTALR